MKKRLTFIMTTACILLITGCGASNSAEDPVGADNQIKKTYVENAGQTDTEENIDDAASSSETREPGLPYGQPMNFDTGGLPTLTLLLFRNIAAQVCFLTVRTAVIFPVKSPTQSMMWMGTGKTS